MPIYANMAQNKLLPSPSPPLVYRRKDNAFCKIQTWSTNWTGSTVHNSVHPLECVASKTLYNQTLDPCCPPHGLTGRVRIVRWRWKLQRVCQTASLYSYLSSCYLSSLAAELEDFDVVLYLWCSLHYQYPVHIKPLGFFTSLWCKHWIRPLMV
jgi:hypothetical protein